MMLYKLLLCLAVFGAMSGVIEQTGFYPVHVPQSGSLGMTEAQVTDLSTGVTNSPTNAFSAWTGLMMIFGVLWSAIVAVVVVTPILTAYGCPLGLAIAIDGLIWIPKGFGLYQMVTGHQIPGME